jgi:hypothetical protein
LVCEMVVSFVFNNIRLWLWIPGSPLRGAPE